MFYHIIIERNSKIGKTGNYEKLYEFDHQDLEKIKTELFLPYMNNKQIFFKGYPLEKKDIRRFAIKCSEQSSDVIRNNEQRSLPPNVIMSVRRDVIIENDKLFKDITTDLLKSVDEVDNDRINIPKKINMSKIFIVHGHDEQMKLAVARFIEKMGFEAIILHEQVNEGLTVIEKFEKFSDTGYGIVLYSPCDVGGKNEENKDNVDIKPRARQNVIFEHGYLIGKLGRNRVAALVEDDSIELPSDIDGILYIPYDDGNWKFRIAKELKNAGYTVDMNLIV